MALPQHKRLKKELSLFQVYALATGTTLSAGLFLLPSFAAAMAGPSLIVAYAIAAILFVPPMLCKIELATAMPRAGGNYYFLDRSLGPVAGTIGGLGTWLALTLKAAFALVGMGAYIALVFGSDTHAWVYKLIAVVIAVLFGFVNLIGAKSSAKAQVYLVCGVLAIMTLFIIRGLFSIEGSNFEPFVKPNPQDDTFGGAMQTVLATAGIVFISFTGATKVISVAEEVKDPERNMPWGLIISLITVVVVYVLSLIVMVGVLGSEQMATGDEGLPLKTPVASAAATFAGVGGVIIVSIAAIMAFASVANAGILSSSRYPMAMGRDHLLPSTFRRLDRRGTPVIAIFVSVAAIVLFVLFLDPLKIAKLASAFLLVMFAMLCLAVIIMRESRIESYDPGWKAPFYPWLQIIGIITLCWLIVLMGWMPALFAVGLVIVSLIWYRWYAAPRVRRHGAIYHVFERLGRRRFEGLDIELREILKEKGLRDEDPFDEVVAMASVIDAKKGTSFDEITELVSEKFATLLERDANQLNQSFLEGTRIGATPVTGEVALPHIRLPDIDIPHMFIVRVRDGVDIEIGTVADESSTTRPVTALFFLVSPDDDPGQHLRLLAQLAGRVEQSDFKESWLKARDGHAIKEVLLRNDRYMTIELKRGSPAHQLIGQAIRDIGFPEGCLVALIQRQGEMIVPRGRTVLKEDDRITTIGEPEAIRVLRKDLLDEKVIPNP